MNCRETIKAIQREVGVRPDGIVGCKETVSAIAAALGVTTPRPPDGPDWPDDDDEAALLAFYGDPMDTTTHRELVFPYPVFLYDTRERVRRTFVHHKCVENFRAWFEGIDGAYTWDQITGLRLDRFFGCYNPRKKRGGSTWSVHAFAAAIDLDANNNRLRWDHTRAGFAKPEYDACWEAAESAGLVNLGRAQDFDWMHTQAATA